MGLVPAAASFSIASIVTFFFGYIGVLAALMAVVRVVQLAIRKAAHIQDPDANATTYASEMYPLP